MFLLQNTRLYDKKLFLSVFDEVMSQLKKIVKNWTYNHPAFALIETFEYIQQRNQSVQLQISQQAITIIAVSSLSSNKTLSRLCSIQHCCLCDTSQSATLKTTADS